MKLLMEEAGQTFVAIIVGLMLLVIIFGVKIGDDTVGILNAMSTAADVQSQNYGTYVDSDAAKAHNDMPASKLLFDYGKGSVMVNTETNMLDYIMVQKAGQTVHAEELIEGQAVYILDISDKLKGTDDAVVCNGGSSYRFMESGVYTIKLKLVDADNKVVYKSLDFSVI